MHVNEKLLLVSCERCTMASLATASDKNSNEEEGSGEGNGQGDNQGRTSGESSGQVLASFLIDEEVAQVKERAERASKDLKKNFNINFQYDVHISAPSMNEEWEQKCSELREKILAWAEDEGIPSDDICLRDCTSQDTLFRYVRARKGVIKDAASMLQTTLKWRLEEKPHLIRAGEEMMNQGRTGKLSVRGRDVYGRPVLVADSTVENTKELKGQLRHVMFNMERCCRVMRNPVQKLVLFVPLTNFSLWSAPSLESTKGTIGLLQNHMPERLGTAIFYNPPTYFTVFLSLVKPFIDPITFSKVVTIKGDCSPGSKNDTLMRNLLGDDWKKLTGVEQPVQKGCTPGFNFEPYWEELQREDEEWVREHPEYAAEN